MNESKQNRKYKIRVIWQEWNPFPAEFENDYQERSLVSKDYFLLESAGMDKVAMLTNSLRKKYKIDVEFHSDDSFLNFTLEEECPDNTAREILDELQSRIKM